MPEKTTTGKWIFPIRDAGEMKKEGWFTRKTNTKGVSVRLARLKSDDSVVVQAYIFDTKKGWDKDKAEKWLKGQDVKWIAALDKESDTFKGKCSKIIMVISEDDMPHMPGMPCPEDDDEEEDENDEEDRDPMDSNKISNNNEVVMNEKTNMIAADGSGVVPIEVSSDTGLPTEIVKVPKRIVTHRNRKKGSNGRPLNLNGKDYGKKGASTEVDSSTISNDLNKCGTGKDEDKDKMKNKCGDGKDDEDKMKNKCGGGGGGRTVRTPKKKK